MIQPDASLPGCAVTGATGYVGCLLSAALRRQWSVVPLVRRPSTENEIHWDFTVDQDITEDLRARNTEVLIHAAWDMRSNTIEELRTSVDASNRLYQMARRAGVKRIIFVSTISAFQGCRSAYGRSKLQVEQMTKQAGGIVLRPGLIYGRQVGGVFGAIKNQVRRSRIVPLIGNGHAPQFLLHQDTLEQCALRAAGGDFDASRGEPITIAHPKPWPFRELVLSIARAESRQVTLVPTPWPLLYAALRSAEALHLPVPFRSDSVLSFVYQDPAPDFSQLQKYGIDPLPFHGAEISAAAQK